MRSPLLRGRVEDLSGWALYNQGKLTEAADHLNRAVNILPEGTPAWRTALWHRGAVLDGLNRKEEALADYIKSYNAGEPDSVRRGVIEQLYRKVNGSLAGLEERVGAAPGTQPANEPLARPAGTNDPTAPVIQAPATSEVTPEATPSPEIPSSPLPQTETPRTAPAAQGTIPSQPDASPSSPDAGRSPGGTPASDTTLTSAVSSTLTRSRATVTVTGRVKDSQNNPIGNVVVVLISPQGTVLASTTDEQGNYSFTIASSTSPRGYRIIPSKDGFTFEPADKVLPVVSDDLKELDFTGSPVPKP